MGGGGSKQTATVENHDPWYGQQPYLKDSFAEAQKIYNQTKANPAYTGDFYAQLRPEQLSTFRDALTFAGPGGQGDSAVSNLTNTGQGAMGLGMGASMAGMEGTAGLAGDNTDTIYGNASKLAASPYADSLITSAMRDANRQASENTLPNLYRSAAGSGNLNSDRTALAQGVVERGLAEKTADVSSQIRSALFDQGLSQASGDLDRRLGASSALTSAGGGILGTGAGITSSGLDGKSGLLDMAGTASDRLQAGDQALIDNSMSKFEYNQAKPWEALGNYYSIIGDKSWGGTTTSFGSVKEKPSGMATAGSLLGVLGSLFKLCDERVKNKIKIVGEIAGVPLWLFSYKHSPNKLEIGPMAQDLEKVHPDAVTTVLGDIKIINLSKL